MPHFEKMLYDNAQLGPRLPPRLPGHRRRLLPPRRRGDAGLRPARDDRTGGRLLLHPGRRQRGRGGEVLRLDRRKRSTRCSAPRTPASSGPTSTSPRGGNFEGHNILHRRRDPGRGGRARSDVPTRRPAGGARAGRASALRGPRAAGPAGAGREGADGLERADAAAPSPRPGPCSERHDYLRRAAQRRSSCWPLRQTLAAQAETVAPAALLEGRAGEAQRLPGGLRLLRRRPAGPLRGDVRSALVRRRREAWRRPSLDQFADEEAGGFFDTSADHESLAHPPEGPVRQRHPGRQLGCGGGPPAARLRIPARGPIESGRSDTSPPWRASVAQHPGAFGRLLSALDFAIGPVQEVALVGDPAGPDTRDLLAALYARYDPNRVLALRPPGAEGDTVTRSIPLLEGRTAIEGRATAYVCQHFACRLPVTTAEALLSQLDNRRVASGGEAASWACPVGQRSSRGSRHNGGPACGSAARRGARSGRGTR